jgi:hypothetical protein
MISLLRKVATPLEVLRKVTVSMASLKNGKDKTSSSFSWCKPKSASQGLPSGSRTADSSARQINHQLLIAGRL